MPPRPRRPQAIISREQALKVIEAVSARSKNYDELLTDTFSQQRAFIEDPAKFKAALCSRRAGKSYACGLLMMKEALENPGVSIAYIALTHDSAERIMYKDILKTINRQFKCRAEFTERPLKVKLPNGSIIYLFGADTSGMMDRLLGQKYKLVVIDECASYKQDLRKLVKEVLAPTVADYDGTIAMIGTPGAYPRGYFYDVTRQDDRTKREKGWAVHEWTEETNPHQQNNRRAVMSRALADNPFYRDTPEYRTQWLGLWGQDQTKLVYKFNPERNLINSFDASSDGYHYVLGVDLGYHDATAFVIAAYHDHDPNLYILETFKKSNLIYSDVAERIRTYQAKYTVERVIIDGAAKQGIEEMRQRHGLTLEAADKRGKENAIEMMNSDLIAGKIKILNRICQPLIDEWQTLIWDEKASKRQELASCPNHLSDAALYAWRKTYAYAAKPPDEAAPSPTSAKYVEQFWEREIQKREEKRQDIAFYGFDPDDDT